MNQRKLCRYGEMVYQPNDQFVGRSLDLYGEYSESEAALFHRLVRPGATVVEVGANIGAHTVPLARWVGRAGRVFAFEPQRTTFYCLCANVVLNNLANVVCRQAAVGAAPGELLVPDLDYDAAQNLGGLDSMRDYASVRHYTVPVVRLDDLHLPACHFLKVGVEGMERQVLQGAIETLRVHRPILYVADDRPDRSTELRALLEALGYEMHVHQPPLYNPNNFAKAPTNVFGKIVSVNLFCHPRGVAAPIQPEEWRMIKVAAEPAGTTVITAANLAELFAIGRQYHQTGKLRHAEQVYGKIVEAEPANAQAWYLLGVVCAALGKAAEAESHTREAVRHQPDHASAHNHLGVLLARAGKREEAEASFRAAQRLTPEDAEVQNNLGMTLLQQGKRAEAAGCFEEALRLRPDFGMARANLRQARADCEGKAP